jgi:AraC-like DNA-binding protein
VVMMSPGPRSIYFPDDQQVHLRVIAFDASDAFMGSSHRIFADRDRRHRLLTEIIDDLRECPPERRDTLLAVALQLFDEVEVEAGEQGDPKLAEVVRHIDANPHQSLGVTELAEMCGYSESHFRRLFREVMGVTPKQYIKKTKMEYALYLLRDEKLPVKEVAATLGYNDTFEFSKQFKTVYGTSPSKKARQSD